MVWCYQVHDVDRGRHIDLRILIDGHNRYEICTRLDIPFDVKEIDFDSRDEAKLWIVQNQLGRRNLTDFAKAEVALAVKPLIEARARANQLAGVNLPLNSAEGIETNIEIANLVGLGKDTVRQIKVGRPTLIRSIRACVERPKDQFRKADGSGHQVFGCLRNKHTLNAAHK